MSMQDSSIFATLKSSVRIWAVGAIHGEVDRLARLHQAILPLLAPGDQIVYLGNYCGHGQAAGAALDELLLFRRRILARPGADVGDVVFLRGAQEEMWQKLLQLQFAPDPVGVLHWMVKEGIAPTIEAYGASVQDAILAARDGILSLTRWTSQLRQSIRAIDGRTAHMNALRHAALTDNGSLLFVHAGIEPIRPLASQGDVLWWGGSAFAEVEEPYEGFARIVRGYDRKHGGFAETPFTLTLDGGAGFGGELLAACFGGDGSVQRLLSA